MWNSERPIARVCCNCGAQNILSLRATIYETVHCPTGIGLIGSDSFFVPPTSSFQSRNLLLLCFVDGPFSGLAVTQRE